ncbi:glucose dehydrogenase [Arenicella chitinivorans]|uniref:Glucose dehydrogenase n=1 Tax=Arenicella chitinivorans TaxID=1329800 RepID=A0A918RM12_9GAMM|nr:PQQ-dependent sugar dehydrogenase [Arenicella chitinivorans]GHA04302.1 glucose dehydrogenase [Arenicella chitinivorans]
MKKTFKLGFALFCLSLTSTQLAVADSNITTVASGLKSPWAMAFTTQGDILITERAGRIRVVRDGQLQPDSIANVPSVYHAGQGGLLDIQLDREFANNRTLYLSLAHGDAKANATRLVAAELDQNQLTNVRVLFTSAPTRATPHHYAGRIAQLPDNTLLLTVGDGFNYREQAQRLDSHLGKIIRVNREGQAPNDNPFIGQPGAKPEIWSIGHRNMQGLTLVADTVYEHEHGPQGGDEINRIEPGKNYGWPVITQGIDYSGARISPFTDYPNMQQPLLDWTPSIAPSGMAYSEGHLYVTALAEGAIRKIKINTDGQLDDLGIVYPDLRERLRDIAVGPDGFLYVLTDGPEARLLRLSHH